MSTCGHPKKSPVLFPGRGSGPAGGLQSRRSDLWGRWANCPSYKSFTIPTGSPASSLQTGLIHSKLRRKSPLKRRTRRPTRHVVDQIGEPHQRVLKPEQNPHHHQIARAETTVRMMPLPPLAGLKTGVAEARGEDTGQCLENLPG